MNMMTMIMITMIPVGLLMVLKPINHVFFPLRLMEEVLTLVSLEDVELNLGAQPKKIM